jgi:hypothetical protein
VNCRIDIGEIIKQDRKLDRRFFTLMNYICKNFNKNKAIKKAKISLESKSIVSIFKKSKETFATSHSLSL